MKHHFFVLKWKKMILPIMLVGMLIILISNDSVVETIAPKKLLPIYSVACEDMRVALTFDCLDNADGLTPILSTLARYGIKATFFINGEFVRRFPTGVNEIIKAGHQCGSMFYSPYFMDNEGFDMTENFVRRGLARNEDDFFELTQHELSLLWHMPNYYLNNIILKAGNDAGYTWVDKGLAPQDMVTFESALKNGIEYQSSSQLIDYVVSNLAPGTVIPVSAGLAVGTRGDFLYDKLDVLVSAILANGYEIVTVSELLQGN